MAVSTAYAPLTSNGNGATTSFPVSWPFFAASTIVVTLISSSGTETVQTISTQYSVAGGTDAFGLPATGTVTMVTAPASGQTLKIERSTPKTQAGVWTKEGSFNAKSLESALDRLTLIDQEAVYNDSWRGAWVTSTAYTAGQSVTNDGSTYTCIVPHTSGSTTEPGAGASWEAYWVVAAASGVDGAIPVVSTVSRSIDTGDHVVMANATAATLTVTSGALWFYVSRSSDSASNVTVDPHAGYTIEGNADGVIINAVVGPVGFIVDPALSTNYITFVPALTALSAHADLVSKTVAQLSALTPTAGLQYFASNGRKNGEGSGLGTGVLVFGDGSNWIASDTGATVAA